MLALVAQKAIIEFQILADFFQIIVFKSRSENKPNMFLGEHGNHVHFYLFNVDMYGHPDVQTCY